MVISPHMQPHALGWDAPKVKEEAMPHTILLDDDALVVDGTTLRFPMGQSDLVDALGSLPDRDVVDEHGSRLLVYDGLGLVFRPLRGPVDWLRKRDAYTDAEHTIVGVDMYCGPTVRPQWRETIVPSTPCRARVAKATGNPLYFISDRDDIGDLHVIRWTQDGHGADGPQTDIVDPLSVSFSPPRTFPPANYTIRTPKEPVLEFEHLNFKLAVIQQLMYELEVLTPRFDLFDFAAQYSGKAIDTESSTVIRPALNWFKRLPIPARLAPQLTTLTMDGGDDVYMNIIPQWDGEDDTFDLDHVNEAELAQFPNLRSATIMSGDIAKVSRTFTEHGIQVTPL